MNPIHPFATCDACGAPAHYVDFPEDMPTPANPVRYYCDAHLPAKLDPYRALARELLKD